MGISRGRFSSLEFSPSNNVFYAISLVENFKKPSAIKNQLDATAEQAAGGSKIISFSIALIFAVTFSFWAHNKPPVNFYDLELLKFSGWSRGHDSEADKEVMLAHDENFNNCAKSI